MWRRQAIDDAGGWQHDTLTEDLDLSYRAQLKASDGSAYPRGAVFIPFCFYEAAANLLTGGDIWIPLTIDRGREIRLNHVIQVFGRLKPDATLPAATASTARRLSSSRACNNKERRSP